MQCAGLLHFTARPARYKKTTNWLFVVLIDKSESGLRYHSEKCLDIDWSELLLRSCHEDTFFTIRTDHDLLRWISNVEDAIGRLAGWRLRLYEFDFDIAHCAGVGHKATYAL